MNKNKSETKIGLKRINPRYINIRENIHQALDLYTMSLYMAFRYESDYSQEDAIITRSAKFLYEKAKISRRQFFLSLNILENFGLVLRDSDNALNSISTYHVAQELNYFNTDCGVVHDMHGVVHHMHTDHYSLSSSIINNTISVSDETCSSNKLIPQQQIIDAYNEHLPELTHVKTVDREVSNKIKKMQKDWPKYQREGKKFTLELFIAFMKFVRTNHSWFITPYVTPQGNTRKNSLRNLISETNLTKFANGEFSAN